MRNGHTTIAVLYGGANSEHEVSLRSARDVVAGLREQGFVVRPVGIDACGVWHAAEVDGLSSAADGSGAPRGVRPELLRGVDVVFPVLHGRYGEDGTVQGAIELAGLPYVGSGVLASAMAMDKSMTWRVASAAGVPMVDTRAVDSLRSLPAAVRGLPLPLFVKPNRAGSSVGASLVAEFDDLAPAVGTALAHDRVALVQPAIRADEVSIGVYRSPDGRTRTTGPSLVRLDSRHEFFDYDGKYGGAGAAIEVPGGVDPELLTPLRDLAVLAFEAIGAEGLARVDFFVAQAGSPGKSPGGDLRGADSPLLLNEINTMPGLTAHSHFPRLCAEAGLAYPDLLRMLVDRAAEIGPR
ncbi:D-alanine--D-alanine ligase [Leifsonia sp. NPDC058292]|uniref:D-alanine--D-alanine ligase family protein n=1 Tax=Leifsonia sp. NPDC058292 TaxID=3346428 RepID=UPI0036DA2B86